MTAPTVHIHYRRPPDRLDVFEQVLLLDSPATKVTLQRSTPIEAAKLWRGTTILEPGSPVVWFTFPGAWHDVGRFHTADGDFTGLYANILTPPEFHGSAENLRWDTTDLFLDLWLAPDGRLDLMDEDQLSEARRLGWVDEALAGRALTEADRLREACERGVWPPQVVEDWTLQRALQVSS